MKYIKKLETLLKYTDDKVINHPLFKFSYDLVNILNIVKVADNFEKSIIKKYFNDDGIIRIIYSQLVERQPWNNFNRGLFEIKLIEINEFVKMKVYAASNKGNTNSQELFKFMKKELSKYRITISDSNLSMSYKFPIGETDNIIRILENIKIYIDSNKYNI